MIYFLSGFLIGGIVIATAFIDVLYNSAGKPTNALERVMRAIERFKRLYEN